MEPVEIGSFVCSALLVVSLAVLAIAMLAFGVNHAEGVSAGVIAGLLVVAVASGLTAFAINELSNRRLPQRFR